MRRRWVMQKGVRRVAASASSIANQLDPKVARSSSSRGIVFTATQIVGDGGGALFIDDAKKSGVPTNTADGGRPLVFLLDGGTSTAVAHSSPSDQLNVIVKGPKHSWAYKINTYLLFNCIKPRSN